MLSIEVLGGLSIRRDGECLPGLASRKAEALLVYLTCTGRVQAREILADLLWEERSQVQALTNLRKVLAELRQALAPYLVITRQAVSLNPSNSVWLDVAVLDAGLHTASQVWQQARRLSPSAADSLERTLALYQGDFLAGFYVRDCAGFETWMQTERERLRRLVVDSLDMLVTWYLDTDTYAAGIQQATRLLELDPLREPAHRQMMRLLAYTGQRQEALAQYETCRRLLHEEMGMEPEAETTALYKIIQTGKLTAVSALTQPIPITPCKPAYHLPLQPTSFVGRAGELAQIAERLQDAECRLLSLVGPGGIGKTRLALQAAADQLVNFADGVYFVPLTPVGSSDLVAPTIAGILQIGLHGLDDPATQLMSYLRERQILLVMDSLEHLLDGVGLLSEMLANAPKLKILTTSRTRLNVQEEWVLTVDGLSYPVGQTTDPPETYSAVQLFAQRARQAQATFSLAEHAPAVIAICQAVQGMPLGIELAASWLRVMPCRQVAEHLGHSLDFLSVSLRNLAERHRSIRAVFDHSWKLLSEPERHVLAVLSVFRGGFDLEAAEQVAGASLSILSGLVDNSLVQLHATGRYDLHELLRQYAAEQLNGSGTAEATTRRHYAYFASLAEQMAAHLYGPEQETWFDHLEVEHDNLSAALAWALSVHDAEAGVHLAGKLAFFWELHGHSLEGLVWWEKLVAETHDQPTSVRITALRNLARFANIDPKGRAKPLSEEALALAREMGDKPCIGWILGDLAIVEAYDDLHRAAAMLQEALPLFRELGDGFGISHMLRRLGWVLTSLGAYEQADVLLEEALTLARTANDKDASGWALFLLGNLAWYQSHDLSRALPLYQASLSLGQEIRDTGLVAFVTGVLGQTAHFQGNLGWALAYYKQALKLSLELRGVQAVGHLLVDFGGLLWILGQPERAARLFGVAAAWLPGHVEDCYPVHKVTNFAHAVAAVRAQLGEAAFAAAWTEGQAMTFDQVIAYALNSD